MVDGCGDMESRVLERVNQVDVGRCGRVEQALIRTGQCRRQPWRCCRGADTVRNSRLQRDEPRVNGAEQCRVDDDGG